MMSRVIILFLLVFMLQACKEIEARRPVTVKTHTTLASTASDLKKLNAIEDAKILDFMSRDSINTYINSKNGFWYAHLIKSENTQFPEYGNSITYSLEIRNLNNQVIYGEDELGLQTYLVDKQDIITGLQLGLKLMNIGDKTQFLIPSYNAYGIVGDQNKISTNQSIIAIITLKTIKQTS